MTKINELQGKAEEISVKNEYSINLMESIKEDFLNLVVFSNKNEKLTFYELQRVSKRIETIFNLLGDLMTESDDLNTELTSGLVKIKREKMEVVE